MKYEFEVDIPTARRILAEWVYSFSEQYSQ